ncbi:FixH family protein [Nonomuraea gerenzanensis]|uniref:YtkA-like domain-containing protein n=1 Tax=Nonomuraea gerenzanensis TaxID=93944 RepID=A0A1M4E8T1_9ACTN|nr:FixH family protein [Nonomuraea gerenzanensis]UBU17409.1 FixH family protein [Nonomuraea gerenzanensis]SBO95162.1 hypothetical protein BN4615_P4678 [Nonomuraea gerenzanensis]
MRKKLVLMGGALVAAGVAVFVMGRAATTGPLELTTTGARYAATVVIEDPKPGRVAVAVEVNEGDADSVAVSAVMADMGHSTPELAATEREPGRFLAEGELFPMSGVWELSIRLDGPAGEEQLAVKALITD